MDSVLEKKELVRKLLAQGVMVSPQHMSQLQQEHLILIRSKLDKKEPIDLNAMLQGASMAGPQTAVFAPEPSSYTAQRPSSSSASAFLPERVSDLTPSPVLPEVQPAAIAPVPLPMLKKGVKILVNYDREPKSRSVQDFVQHLTARYKAIRRMLEDRPDLRGSTSINKVLSKTDGGQVAIIGVVYEKTLSQKGNWMITLEDPTGQINVVINKNKPELFTIATELVYDEVIGVTGATGNKVVFADKVIQPDVPVTKELKKAPDEAYAVFTSDIHVGTTLHLREDFEKFIDWINGEAGSEEQRRIASKVRYLIMAGDMVEGVGIFPNQEKYLNIKDIYAQYKELALLLSRIRKDIEIVIAPGNHDALRLSEPQPVLSKHYAPDLHALPNVVFVTNPSYINIHGSEKFPGFDVLIYHGSSFHYYANHVDRLRLAGGIKKAELIMQFLLKRRHLAPAHTSNLYIPDADRDYLVIDPVPDFFVTGDIHRVVAENYKNVTLINSSAWSKESDNQVKLGIEPLPSRAIVVNLQTRAMKIMKFSADANVTEP